MSTVCDPKLLLSAREAARALSVCEKTLWSMTVPRGSIPCARIGSRVLYNPESLRRFIAGIEGGQDAK
jgi:hypothetical protein